MFFLGRTVSDDQRFELKPATLTTHGLCVGMTGSGKTGLCLALLEELRQAGIPSLVLDPKGDLGSLALAFPDLAPTSFRPWVDPAAARLENKTPDDAAFETAARWREGLDKEGLRPDAIAAMNERCPVVVYTPGSTAGRPLNVLTGLADPGCDDLEIRGEMLKTATLALLGLIGVESDPLTGREFILLSNLIDTCWQNKQPAELERLIAYVQNPPLKRIGVFSVDSFFPADKRNELAWRLNGLLASPGFATWMTGTPLEIDRLWRAPDGRAQSAIVYLAHLETAERLFVISLILSRLTAWLRRQPGSEELRGLLFLDEAQGFAPPHPQNPPSKAALVTLYKQARAFGLGVVVATQNPMDLDYKIFSNAGLWMIGRLATENDRRRVVEGLRGVAGAPDNLESVLAGLGKRQFFIRDIHRPAPAVIRSRFIYSYLRGPLTRDDIARLGGEEKTAIEAPRPVAAPPGLPEPPFVKGVVSYFLKPEAFREAELAALFRADDPAPQETVVYHPAFYASCRIRYDDPAARVLHEDTISRSIYPLDELTRLPAFADDEKPWPDLHPFLADTPAPNARFMPLPAVLDDPDEFRQAMQSLVDACVSRRHLPLWVNRGLKLFSRPGETESEFLARCEAAAAEEARDELARVHGRSEAKLARLEERRRQLQGRLGDAQADAKARNLESVAGLLENAAGFLFGRRRSVGRVVSSTLSKRRMAATVERRQDRFEDDLAALEDDIAALRDEMQADDERITQFYEDKAVCVESYPVTVERSDVKPLETAIIWVPRV